MGVFSILGNLIKNFFKKWYQLNFYVIKIWHWFSIEIKNQYKKWSIKPNVSGTHILYDHVVFLRTPLPHVSWNLECELNVRHLTQYNTHHVELIWTKKDFDLTYQNLPGPDLLFYSFQNHFSGTAAKITCANLWFLSEQRL